MSPSSSEPHRFQQVRRIILSCLAVGFLVHVIDRNGINSSSVSNSKVMANSVGSGSNIVPNHSKCFMVYDQQEDQNCPVQPIAKISEEHRNCRPNYFIAGARKGGTTSLHTYLTSHPKIFPYKIEGGPQDGESLKKLGKQEMFEVFSDVPEDQLVGESTVARMIRDGFGRFAEMCPHAKILLLLRDPVERCHSQMIMRNRLGTAGVTNVSAAIEKEVKVFKKKVQEYPEILTEVWEENAPLFQPTKNCLFEGAYVAHLRRLFHPEKGVAKEKVRIYWSDDFFQNPAAVVRDAMAFVGVDPSVVDLDRVTAATFNGRNQSRAGLPELELLPELRREMEETMRPFDEELEQFLEVTPPWMN